LGIIGGVRGVSVGPGIVVFRNDPADLGLRARVIGVLKSLPGVFGTSVSNQNNSIFNGVTAAAVGGTLIDAVDEVDALANRITFNNPHTHDY
jgi:hypothetical protein